MIFGYPPNCQLVLPYMYIKNYITAVWERLIVEYCCVKIVHGEIFSSLGHLIKFLALNYLNFLTYFKVKAFFQAFSMHNWLYFCTIIT